MKLWGGRFSKQTDSLVQQFNESLPFDVRLYDEDITASIVWARGLVRANVLSEQEAATIINGLEQIRSEFQQGAIEFNLSDEDVHTLVERRLTEIVGPVGGKLHTGRSRNDQVATDFRLWTMRAVDQLLGHVASLQKALLDRASVDLNLPRRPLGPRTMENPLTYGAWNDLWWDFSRHTIPEEFEKLK